eukprot:2147220-Amphidinium_carterae.1
MAVCSKETCSQRSCGNTVLKRGAFHLKCAIRVSALDREMNFDDDTSDVEQPSAVSCEVYTTDSVEAKHFSSKGREQLVLAFKRTNL